MHFDFDFIFCKLITDHSKSISPVRVTNKPTHTVTVTDTVTG